MLRRYSPLSARLVTSPTNPWSLTSVSPEHARTLPPAPPRPERVPTPLPKPWETHDVAVSDSPPRGGHAPSKRTGSDLETQLERVRTPTGQWSKALQESARRELDQGRSSSSTTTTARDKADSLDDQHLETLLLRVLNQIDASSSSSSRPTGTTRDYLDLVDLAQLAKDRAGTVLGTSLAYESTPNPNRRVRAGDRPSRSGSRSSNDVDLASLLDVDARGESAIESTQDGVVVVAHVVGGRDPFVSVCSGFAVGEVESGQGQTLLTCLHTLDEAEGHLSRTASTSTASRPHPAPSATLALTSSGHIFTVSSVLSSLPESDLLLVQLSRDPVQTPPTSPSCPRLRALPVNPYPPPSSTCVSIHTYLNPLSRLRRKLAREPEKEWRKAKIVEYKDPIGRTAEPGTYDELQSFWIDGVPTAGSSGGPIVENESGSVVGVTRGSTHKYGERQAYGFATPAERIFDMFALPGFKTTHQRALDRELLERERERERREYDEIAATAGPASAKVETSRKGSGQGRGKGKE